MIKKAKKTKVDADTWLRENFEYVVDTYGGRYLVIVDGVGIAFTDKDGSPRQLALKAKRKYPRSKPLFFVVPKPQDFLCALAVR